VVGRGGPEEEDQMMAWRAEPETGQRGACWMPWGVGDGELIVTENIRLCWLALRGWLEMDLYKFQFLDGRPDGYGTILYTFQYTWGSRGKGLTV
jgi:hypothetical protein